MTFGGMGFGENGNLVNVYYKMHSAYHAPGDPPRLGSGFARTFWGNACWFASFR